ncbi:hypothetical protein K474DRAFT_363566 [Panus rudis PR-1116 ss-1]|nr:hypothetical protein K474DRAFT_363566 [Panus rudis PR-1116 ss-1]
MIYLLPPVLSNPRSCEPACSLHGSSPIVHRSVGSISGTEAVHSLGICTRSEITSNIAVVVADLDPPRRTASRKLHEYLVDTVYSVHDGKWCYVREEMVLTSTSKKSNECMLTNGYLCSLVICALGTCPQRNSLGKSSKYDCHRPTAFQLSAWRMFRRPIQWILARYSLSHLSVGSGSQTCQGICPMR